MLAWDYTQAEAKKKGVGLHYSRFQNPMATLPTTYASIAPENRRFCGRIAEVGLVSPEKAARRAERAARQAEQRRREKGRIWLMIGGLALVSIALVIADFFWLRHRANQRHEQRHHHSERTNSSTSIPMDGPQGPTTNHE